jgi:hypothetical protein
MASRWKSKREVTKMDLLSWVLLIIALLVLTGGLLYTYRIGKRQKLQGEYDTEIDEKVAEHPYILNPVFLAYFIGIGLVIVYALYIAIRA